MIRIPGGTSEVRVLFCELVYSENYEIVPRTMLRGEGLRFFWYDDHRLLVVYEPHLSHVALDRVAAAVRRWSMGNVVLGDVDFLTPHISTCPIPPSPPSRPSRREEAERKLYREGYRFGRAIRRYLKEMYL